MHTYTHTDIHTYLSVNLPIYLPTGMHTYIHTLSIPHRTFPKPCGPRAYALNPDLFRLTLALTITLNTTKAFNSPHIFDIRNP